jgi:hypothetical protein
MEESNERKIIENMVINVASEISISILDYELKKVTISNT